MVSIYQLKPAFQNILRPMTRQLAAIGVTANMVTIFACLCSCLLGGILLATENMSLFLLLPLWMFLRMALNAIDGLLAREFNQQSALGAYLNELTDVVSDAALYLPFIFIAPFNWVSISLIIFLATLSEMTGALAPMVGAKRCYDGPMGKSDRAFIFGALGLWLGFMGSLPSWLFYLVPIIALLIIVNIVNRIRSGIQQVSDR